MAPTMKWVRKFTESEEKPEYKIGRRGSHRGKEKGPQSKGLVWRVKEKKILFFLDRCALLYGDLKSRRRSEREGGCGAASLRLPSWPTAGESERPAEFKVDLDLSGAPGLGLEAEGAVPPWNKSNPTQPIAAGDRLLSINGTSGDPKAMLAVCKQQKKLALLVRNGSVLGIIGKHALVALAKTSPVVHCSPGGSDFVSKLYDTRVHGDYTPTSAAEIFEWQLSKVEPTKAAAYREGHFLLINAWRNLNPQPVEHDTLAVCDARSVADWQLLQLPVDGADGVRAEPLSAESFTERVQGPMASVESSTYHRWFYFPSLRNDELLIFKCYDSGATSQEGRYVLHSAIRLPGVSTHSPRESIEVRMIAFFTRKKRQQLSELPTFRDGQKLKVTQIITQCVNPSWNQILEENIKLPEDVTLRPDVLITLLDSDEGSFEPMVQMRLKASEIYEPEPDAPESTKSPRWYQLEPVPGGVPTQGKLLAAFELIRGLEAGCFN
eukprot:symbB.v1.2.017080.t1/scaffold1312.1/size125759/2